LKKLFPEIQRELEDPVKGAMAQSIGELRRREEGKYRDVVFYYLNKEYRLGRGDQVEEGCV
jgi:hypothetical protein